MIEGDSIVIRGIIKMIVFSTLRQSSFVLFVRSRYQSHGVLFEQNKDLV